jgi:GT2 family glycosyltransferase
LRWRPRATPGRLPEPLGLLPSPIGANCGLRAQTYRDAGGFDPAFAGAGEETDLFFRVALAGHPAVYVPGAVVAYRHRAGLRDLLRQWRHYGRARAQLVARYQHLGLRPERPLDVLRTCAWVLAHSVDLVRGADARVRYLRMLAHLLGQLEGSRRHRVLHLGLGVPPRAPAQG